MRSTTTKALRLGAASALLAMTMACGLREEAAPVEVTSAIAPAVPAPAPVINGSSLRDGRPTPAPSAGVGVPSRSGATQMIVGIPLETGFMPDPHIARGQAGGPNEGRTMAPQVPLCRGWVPATPQHTITLTTHFARLRVLVSAQADTTLLIRGPDGRYRCADDDEELNPIVEGAFEPGTYQVYVGAYSQGASTPYVIGFTERRSVTAESLGS